MSKSYSVSVVGPGALGCLFAGKLAKAGFRVHLIDHKQDRITRLTKNGIEIHEGDKIETYHVHITSHIPAGQDLIIVLVKSYSTASLVLPQDTIILTLQNGLGNVEILCKKTNAERILAGTTTESATLLEEGKTKHTASGVTVLGSWTTAPVKIALDILEQAGFKIEITNSPGQVIWEKTVINAGINPLTAILNVPNGALLKIREARELLRELVAEASKVAGTEGYRFSRSMIEYAEETCELTANNISSMLQDIRNGRKTEIEAISGEIMRRGTSAFLTTPRTRTVYQLVRSLEQREIS
ncbi:MAG TPA: 2-dehydropantoate 2-reductase [Candidatus Hydrogenedens sp.]|nr:2-dehydropantoate 2-reductase [Candidatus Hydrogenedens sp.]HPP59275.1 2-dehydropantoate 2-reductase [Candidatus Hydrogenedens sp.]